MSKTDRMGVGRGVSPVPLTATPQQRTRAKNRSKVEARVPVKTTWEKVPQYPNSANLEGATRLGAFHAKVFDMSDDKDRTEYENIYMQLVDWNPMGTIRLLAKERQDPPDAGSKNLRIFLKWGDLEFKKVESASDLTGGQQSPV